MTGLDSQRDTILEVACIITDANLNIIAQTPDIIIHHSDEALNTMSEWCIEQHGKVRNIDAIGLWFSSCLL
jgi:oligoribonuclease